ncbi:MAG: hypothetical protein DCF22_18135, partial [Leptolyngbya sp.]
MPQLSKLSSLTNRVKNSLPSKQTAILRLKDGGIIVGFLASAYLFVPPLWDAISVSPQQRVKPLEQRIADLDKQIKSSPKPSTTDLKEIATLEKGRIDTEHAIRTTIVQAMVGFLGIATVGIAWKQWKAAQEKQVAERFSKAVELLGNEKIHAQLGGIYALEQIAKDAEEKYYWQVMETLTSYVREESRLPELSDCGSLEELQNVPLLSGGVQTAMTVLARRKHPYNSSIEPHRLNLSFTDLRRLRIPDGIDANFDGADFRGSKLQKAWLTNVSFKNTLFSYADLKETHFYGAQLQKSNLTLTVRSFSGWLVRLWPKAS